MIRQPWSAGGPNTARMVNFLLGGKDNYEVDRAACLTLLEDVPDLLGAVWAARQFTLRAVEFLANAGVGQFVDVGCGLPLEPTVHEVAGRRGTGVRTIYVDDDRLVAVYARALLTTPDGAVALEADLTQPDRMLTDPQIEAVLDRSKPAAVLVNNAHLLHDDAIRRVTTAVTSMLAPGSFLAISHLTGVDAAAAGRTSQLAAELGLNWRLRSPTRIRQLVAGLRPVSPGLVQLPSWRPDPKPQPCRVDATLLPFLTGQDGGPQLGAYGGVLTNQTTDQQPADAAPPPHPREAESEGEHSD